MKKVSITLLAAVAALSLATTAEAKTGAKITTFGEVDYAQKNVKVTLGQVTSSKRECFSNRRFFFTFMTKNDEMKGIDTGKTSLDGAISGGYDTGVVKNRPLFFTLIKTKECAGKTVLAEPPDVMRASRAMALKKPVGSVILVLGLRTWSSDGVLGGLVGLEKRAKCFYNRKMKLLADGAMIDRGTTNFGGAFGFHITEGEFVGATKLVFKVAKSKRKNGTVCGAAKTTIVPST